MFSLKEYREPRHRMPDYLPWATFVAPGVVLQKDTVFQKTYAFRGPDLSSASRSELISAVSLLNNALKRLGSGWSLHCEAQRFESNIYELSDWPNAAATLIDLERQSQFTSEGNHFQSSYFITFCWQMPSSKGNNYSNIFYDDPKRKNNSVESDNEKDLEYFLRICGDIYSLMQGVFVEVYALSDDETCTYLHSTISPNRHFVKCPETPMYLDALLPDVALTIGDICMLGDYYIPTISFIGYPSETFPAILDDLNNLQIEYRWTTRYISLDKEDANKELYKYRKQWFAKRKGLGAMLREEATKEASPLLNSDAIQKAADTDSAILELGNDHVSFGFMTVTVIVMHKDYDESMRRIREVKKVIQSRGFTVKDETLQSFDAWLGSLPGQNYSNVRRPLVSTLNLCHILPISAIWAGNKENKHLKEVTGMGAPHVVCSTAGATPFQLSLNVGDVGHTLIIGPTGAGKSTLLAMLAIQFLRYPNAQVIIFDKDRSARAATLAVMGEYFEPAGANKPLAFQPLAKLETPTELQWASEFILLLLNEQHVTDTPSIKKEIDGALESLKAFDLQGRTLTAFIDCVQATEVRDALRPYTLEGNYGQIFDADETFLPEGFWLTFEMGSLMQLSQDALIPALFYLFHVVDERFDGRPTLLILDEAWLFLRHHVFSSQLQNWLKTLRKKNVYVVFATQEVADAGKSSIMSTILSACLTKIYLPDKEALVPAMSEIYTSFGLSDTEIRMLASLQPKKEYFLRSSSGRRVFSLNMGPVSLAFCGFSSPDDQVALDAIERDYPKNERASEILKHRKLIAESELCKTLNKK